MKYSDYLINVLKSDCPFCDIKKDYILEKWKHFSVILSRAPYIVDHLLIVPNRHIIRLWEINSEEWNTLIPLIRKWIKKLEKIHKEVNLLLRDGVADWIIWKSIDHLHFHLVPDCPIYSSNSWLGRKIFSDHQYLKRISEFRVKVKWK